MGELSETPSYVPDVALVHHRGDGRNSSRAATIRMLLDKQAAIQTRLRKNKEDTEQLLKELDAVGKRLKTIAEDPEVGAEQPISEDQKSPLDRLIREEGEQLVVELWRAIGLALTEDELHQLLLVSHYGRSLRQAARAS